MRPEEIYVNDAVYNFLIYYYLEELSNPYLTEEISSIQNQRWSQCVQLAAWLHYEKNYDKIRQRLYELTEAGIE